MSIIDLIERARLAKTILSVGPFYPQLIREFVVNFPNELNDQSSPDYQTIRIWGFKFVISPIVINGFLGNVIDVDCSPSSPSTDILASVLSSGTLSTWSVNGILVVALSIKYVILHKSDIANWFPSSHAFSVSAAFGTFLYQLYSNCSFVILLKPATSLKWGCALSYRLFQGSQLVARIVNALTADLSINLLFEQRLEIDALIRHLKTFVSSTSRREPTTD
ncbi:uncharacterized protein E5676_scaffold648G001110 [Cucumis melo var. makuwa]|uniref:Putative plant transposon protein domain-containing protein n=1 Tax=Cucumis melo var. makuwa TaxID=1194695 RepID=A0A5D3CDA0_CUCMM|nr:uncharacterized protein E6C27_scaffold115G001560 [Cucumis melo var. makuwa]TYK08319.1 uncharacterized protein E5676_scaffold648G001110 [Cucumis melo var. makuwa]